MFCKRSCKSRHFFADLAFTSVPSENSEIQASVYPSSFWNSNRAVYKSEWFFETTCLNLKIIHTFLGHLSVIGIFCSIRLGENFLAKKVLGGKKNIRKIIQWERTFQEKWISRSDRKPYHVYGWVFCILYGCVLINLYGQTWNWVKTPFSSC